MGKNIVKGATQVNELLKIIFLMFKISQKKCISLDCYNFFWNIFH
jgi:hypothetical protein